MRVAIIAPHYAEYSIRYAASMGKRCEVLVLVDAEQLGSEFAGRDIPQGQFQLGRLRFKQPLDLLKLLVLVIRFRPTVIHFQEAAGLRRGLFNAFIATVMKPFVTIVLTVHDPVPHLGRDVDVARRMSAVRDYLRRLAEIVVVHGAFCERLIMDSGTLGRGRIARSAHGVLLEPMRATPVPRAPLRLYFFGRMEAYKGLEVLLTAVERLHGEGLAFTLSIAGRGPELDRLADRFQKLPEVDVRNEFIPPNDIINSIQGCACVLLPYLTATQSGVLAAAFAGGRSVIASDTGGIADVVRHEVNGLLVRPGDPDALADAISQLADNAILLAKLQSGAMATARDILSWDRIANELHEIFDLCGKFRGGLASSTESLGPRR